MVAPNYYQAGGMPFRPQRKPDYRYADLSTQPVPPEPHLQLGAEVRTLHLWLVESSVYFHGADVDAISAAVCLPLWNVRLALFALGLGPDPRKPVKLKDTPNYATARRSL